MKSRTIYRIGIAAILLFGGLPGCASRPVGQTPVKSPVYETPAIDLLKRVQVVLASPPISLQSEDLGHGILLTDWQQSFRGDFHLVRFWHERTRYRITISPDFVDPGNRSSLEIVDETQQRPDEGGFNVEARTWHDAPSIHRPERAEALLKQIQAQLMNPAPIALPSTLPSR
jgi:hypothetical protein